MKTIFIDFETFYSTEYSLRKMTPVEYVLDPRFECIGAGMAGSNTAATWFEPDELAYVLQKLPEKVAFVSHNALFDMCVLAWRFNYVPALMIDTMGMARATLAHKLRSLSLDSVAQELGLGVKGKTVHKVQGMTKRDIIAAGLYPEYKTYSCDDTDLCKGIYLDRMAAGFPVSELLVMDTVLRCAVRPKFVLDNYALAEHLHIVKERKQNLLDRCGLENRDALMSNDRFAEALRTLGVEPPTKISLRTKEITYAFAKTDADFIELEEHENPDVQALVAARMGLKTTLEETRTERLMRISTLQWQDGSKALMPIPLRYSGAHTHRLSGDWKINMQNLPRGGKLRDALKAPKGRKVVAADAAQIEARLVAWFCGCTALVSAFANGEDVYSSFASTIFGFPVNKKDNPDERFVGKQSILGLGFGMGAPKFAKNIVKDARLQLGKALVMLEEEARRIVNLYRSTYPEIPAMWRRLDRALQEMTNKDCDIWIGPVRVQFESILLPNGLRLYYHKLRNEDGQWVFEYNGKKKYIYGGKLLENIIQALARILTMDAAVRTRVLFTKIGDDTLELAMQVHDELVYLPDEDIADYASKIIIEEMSRRPSWAPDLPLAAEASKPALSYGEAK